MHEYTVASNPTERQQPLSSTQLLALTAMALAFAIATVWLHPNTAALNYDEGDYYRAIGKGFVTNWFDTDDIPIDEFVSQGLKAVRGEISRGELSRQARERQSAAFLRHYHSPLVFYPAIVVRALTPGLAPEAQLRATNIVWMAMWIICFGLLLARWPQLRRPWFIVLPASASWAAATVGFNMHILFGLAASTFGVLWYAYEQDRASTALKRTAIVFLGVAVCSVEYSLYLLGFLFLWGVKSFWACPRSGRKAMEMEHLRDVALLLGVMILLWPAGVLKLGLLKSYAITSFIATFRLGVMGDAFGSVWEMLLRKWNPSALELVVGGAVVVAMLANWRAVWRRGSLFVTLGLTLAIMYTQTSKALNLLWYLFPVFAMIYVFYLGVIAERWPWMKQHAVSLAMVLAVVFFGVTQLVFSIPNDHQISTLRDAVAAMPGPEIIAAQGVTPQLSAYFPKRRIRGLQPDEFQTSAIRDSLDHWLDDHIVIAPKNAAINGRKVVETTEYVMYGPRR